MSIQTIVNGQVVVVGASAGMDISGFVGEIRETPGKVTVKDYATLGSGGYLMRAAGQKGGQWGIGGYFDAAAGGIAETITTGMLGQTCGFSTALPSSGYTYGEGAWCQFGSGVLANEKITLNADDIGKIDLGFASTSGFATGVVGAPLASRSSTFTGGGVALAGPTATQRMWALLLIPSGAAGTNLAVKVQSDDNGGFSSATDRITFSTVSASGWQLGSVAGNLVTETFWRVTGTIGTGTFPWFCAFGIA